MPQRYRQIVSELRESFPWPVAEGTRAARFVALIERALGQVEAMNSAGPLLGSRDALDFGAARRGRIGEDPVRPETVTERLVAAMSGMCVWSDPRVQGNVDPVPTIPSLIGGLLAAIVNPNLVSDQSSWHVAVAETEAASIVATLVGYDPEQSGGLFTFGGTGTMLYGVKLGLEKCSPGTMQTGVRGPARIVCSEHAHYAARTVAGWLGLGSDSVIEIPADRNHGLRTCLLETTCRDLLKRGEPIATVIATVGTTEVFGIDDVEEMVFVRNRLVDEFSLDYVPHIHADAVIGWAWSVFNDYDFETNPLGFRERTKRALAGTRRRVQHLRLADSIGIDFHKTGFTPYVSSLFLSRAATDFELLERRSAETATPYFSQTGRRQPGRFTLETSRPGGGPLAALANLLLFGKNGLRSLLGHLVDVAETLRERLEEDPAAHVLSSGNFGPVTLFRAYPDGVDASRFHERERTDPACREKVRELNDFNRRILEILNVEFQRGAGPALSLSGCYETDYGEPMVALKSYITGPFTDVEHIEQVLAALGKARERVAREMRERQ
jgi:glutamate/tyrosine decarboxylase-like PLP-dependent enzyme